MQNGRIACTLSALLGISFTAQAETLLIDRVKINPAAAPMRGQSIAQVETHYGTPTEKLSHVVVKSGNGQRLIGGSTLITQFTSRKGKSSTA